MGIQRSASPDGPVLVLDGEWGSSLAIVRSLGRRGIEVHVASSRSRCLASASRYCRRSFRYPDPMSSAEAFRDCLKNLLATRSYSLLIPVTEKTIVPLAAVRQEFEALVDVAMADSASLEKVLSKKDTLKVARSAEVPIPISLVVESARELSAQLDAVTFPVVLKPNRSKVWLDGEVGFDLGVTYASDRQELLDKAAGLLPFGPVILQERVAGEGVGVGALAGDGETLFMFQYRRLHEVPLSGGASSYRVSEALEETLQQHTRSLLRALAWTGVAMIEFKRELETGELWFMEINGRFWGSLPLPVAAGADFPSMLHDLLVHERRRFPQVYSVGIRCRSLERELRWIRQAIFRRNRAAACTEITTRSIVGDSLQILSTKDRWDTFSWTDPRPGLRALSAIAGKLTGKFRWAYRRRALLAKMWIQRHSRSKVRERLSEARSILVVCSGNVIRSPYAEVRIGECIEGEGRTTSSAGLDAMDGRAADPRACRRAKARGVDLSGHASTRLSDRLVRGSDLVLAMDADQVLELYRRFPTASRKTLLLRCWAPNGPLEIRDPIGLEDAAYDNAFGLIDSALDGIFPPR